MGFLVHNETKQEFRYGSGLTLYSEKLSEGRLLSTDYHAAGMSQQAIDRIADNPVPAFDLEIDGQDASYGWVLAGWEEKRAADGRPLAELVLQNNERSLQLKIETYCGDDGYYTRQMFLTNLSGEATAITRVSPLCGTLWEVNEEIAEPLQDGDLIPYTVGGFLDNWWGMEGNFGWRDVPYNTTVEFGSDTGRSGHSHPFAIVHNKVLGGYFVCQLEWSGNWRFRFNNDFRHVAGQERAPGQYIRLRFDLAPEARAPMRVVDPGETVKLPSVHFGYTYQDLDGAIQSLHAYQRRYILARGQLGYEPTYSAHWGYEGWDMDPERLKTHIDRVAAMGIEMFLVDAGWYGKPGSNWATTVGDWQDERVPGSLKEVIDYTHSKGMLFGLWIEPEAIGPESAIRKEHPEWLLQRYGHEMERCLDLGNAEVEAWVEHQVMDIIERYDIDLLRIDANNEYVYEGGFVRHGRYNENTHWRCVEALYRIFDHVHERYPDLLLENCAAGGARTDLGLMRRFSRTQYSDWGKLPRVARIFNGLSLCLPPETLLTVTGSSMSAHRYGNVDALFQMAMQGSFYINPLAPADEPANETLDRHIRDYIDLYKSFIRPIQNECRMYHHTPVVPGFQGRGWVVNEFVSQDQKRAYAALFRLAGTEQDTWVFRPRGLDRAATYKVTRLTGEDSFCVSGYELAETGVSVRLDGPLTSQMLLFEMV